MFKKKYPQNCGRKIVETCLAGTLFNNASVFAPMLLLKIEKFFAFWDRVKGVVIAQSSLRIPFGVPATLLLSFEFPIMLSQYLIDD